MEWRGPGPWVWGWTRPRRGRFSIRAAARRKFSRHWGRRFAAYSGKRPPYLRSGSRPRASRSACWGPGSGALAGKQPDREERLAGSRVVVGDEDEKPAPVRQRRPQRHPLEIGVRKPPVFLPEERLPRDRVGFSGQALEERLA